jgi:WWE domain
MKWQEYNAKTTNQIERAFMKNQKTTKVIHLYPLFISCIYFFPFQLDEEWFVDFKEMVQKSKTNKLKRITIKHETEETQGQNKRAIVKKMKLEDSDEEDE